MTSGKKTSAIEVKSSGTGKHESLDDFARIYSDCIDRKIILSQKDFKREGDIEYMPFYVTPFLLEQLANSVSKD